MAGRDTRLQPLQTRLYRPRVSDGFVARPRLTLLLEGARQRRVILVAAPAGFGKTAFVSDWLDAAAVVSTWLSIDKNDNDLLVFLGDVLAALETLSPGGYPNTSSLLRAPPKPEPQIVASTLISEVRELDREIVLVLDDYHLITDSTIHDVMIHLVEHHPPNLHLILITREYPPLPLARWRAEETMSEILAADLRFRPAEARNLLAAMLGTTIAEDTANALEETTEGWVVGLRMAALSLRVLEDHAGYAESFKQHSDPNVRDYLVDEVLSRQSPALQDFLLRTSILESFCAPLCEALVDRQSDPPAANDLIDDLVRANLFVTPLDDRGEWYRYHTLFREMLRYRFGRQSGEAAVVEANDRASAWLASHGYVEEALRHALAGGEPLVAARIIEQNAHLPQNHEDPRRLEGWLSLLPAQLLSTRPALVAARASVLTFEGQYQLIPVLLEQAEALLDAASDEEDAESANVVQGQILAYWSNLCVLAGDSARAEDCARRALDLLPPEWQWARGHALAFQCIALHMSGQGELAANLLSQAEAASVGRTDAFTISLPYARCWIHLFAGELGKLLEEAQRLLLQTLQHCCPIARGWGHFFLGFVHYQWNELDMAASNFAEGSGVTDAAHGFQVSMCIVGSAIVSLAQGHFDEARQYLERLAELDHEQGMDTAVERSALRARVALAQNDKESAIQWSLAYQVSPARSAMIHLEFLHLSRARILIAEGTAASLAAALELLETFLGFAEEMHNAWRAIEIRALQALALDALGRREDALGLLEHALVAARPGGFIRMFVDLGPPMAELLLESAERHTAPAYVERILAAFLPTSESHGEHGARTRPVPARNSLLTEREYQVLLLLAQQLHAKEIATMLVITTGTVKKHSAHIYDKLGVNNRRAAVARAQELGLIDA